MFESVQGLELARRLQASDFCSGFRVSGSRFYWTLPSLCYRALGLRFYCVERLERACRFESTAYSVSKGAGRNWNSTSGLPMRKDPTDKVGYSSASGVVRFRSGLGIESRAGAVDFRFQNLSLCQA